MSDWSSDVCSSDLGTIAAQGQANATALRIGTGTAAPDLIVTGAIGAKGGSGEGHEARAIDIAAGATVTHLTNSGAITTTTRGKGGAAAIYVRAGGPPQTENSAVQRASAYDHTAQASTLDLPEKGQEEDGEERWTRGYK